MAFGEIGVLTALADDDEFGGRFVVVEGLDERAVALKGFDVRDACGSEFTAQDVVFTLERVPNVPNSPSSFATYSKQIAVEWVAMKKADPAVTVLTPTPTEIAGWKAAAAAAGKGK